MRKTRQLTFPFPPIPKILLSVSNNRNSCLLENDKLALIINKLSKKFKFKIIISSLSSDYEKALKLEKKLIPEAKINVTPKLSDFLELINSSDLCFFPNPFFAIS